MKFVLLLFLSVSVVAGVPVDIVFDIDQTIVTLVHDGPGGDFLADPVDPNRNVVGIEFQKEGSLHRERYRVYEGLTDLMVKLREEQRAGRVRISFFSGGHEPRNEALLKKILLPDGTSLWDLSSGRSLGRSSLTATGLPETARIRHRFKKDLTKINPDLSDVIIIDDIQEFVPDSQRGNMFWIGEDFPYPERVHVRPASVDPEILHAEKYKYQWISEKLEGALAERFRSGRPLSAIIQNAAITGKGCTPHNVLDRLLFTNP